MLELDNDQSPGLVPLLGQGTLFSAKSRFSEQPCITDMGTASRIIGFDLYSKQKDEEEEVAMHIESAKDNPAPEVGPRIFLPEFRFVRSHVDHYAREVTKEIRSKGFRSEHGDHGVCIASFDLRTSENCSAGTVYLSIHFLGQILYKSV